MEAYSCETSGNIYQYTGRHITGDLNNEEGRDICFLPDIMMRKSRRMRCTGHLARIGQNVNVCRGIMGKLKKRDYLEDLGEDVELKLK